MRVGMGYDVHKLTEGRIYVYLLEIPHTLGLLGHSDADVLLHAVMDALLGAAALGDIGKHFRIPMSGTPRDFQPEAAGACGRAVGGVFLCDREY